jgi:hypothetical protein
VAFPLRKSHLLRLSKVYEYSENALKPRDPRLLAALLTVPRQGVVLLRLREK